MDEIEQMKHELKDLLDQTKNKKILLENHLKELEDRSLAIEGNVIKRIRDRWSFYNLFMFLILTLITIAFSLWIVASNDTRELNDSSKKLFQKIESDLDKSTRMEERMALLFEVQSTIDYTRQIFEQGRFEKAVFDMKNMYKKVEALPFNPEEDDQTIKESMNILKQNILHVQATAEYNINNSDTPKQLRFISEQLREIDKDDYRVHQWEGWSNWTGNLSRNKTASENFEESYKSKRLFSIDALNSAEGAFLSLDFSKSRLMAEAHVSAFINPESFRTLPGQTSCQVFKYVSSFVMDANKLHLDSLLDELIIIDEIGEDNRESERWDAYFLKKWFSGLGEEIDSKNYGVLDIAQQKYLKDFYVKNIYFKLLSKHSLESLRRKYYKCTDDEMLKKTIVGDYLSGKFVI